jgi:hypothetical protein
MAYGIWSEMGSVAIQFFLTSRRIMQPHTQIIEVKNIVQRLGEIVEQLG